MTPRARRRKRHLLIQAAVRPEAVRGRPPPAVDGRESAAIEDVDGWCAKLVR